MQEKNRATLRSPSRSIGGGSAIWDELATADGGGAMATVAHGVYADTLPVANMTVGAVRVRFRDQFDIDPSAMAVIDGRPVDEGTVVQPGQLLTFVRRAGEKGWVACSNR
jgi:hypothetical protein